MRAIPLPLPSSSTTTHLLRRPFSLSNHPISLLSTTTPPHLLPLHTTTTSTPPFSTTPFIPHSIPQSQTLPLPENNVGLDNQTDQDEDKVLDCYDDKVVDFDDERSLQQLGQQGSRVTWTTTSNLDDKVDFDEDKVEDFNEDKVVDSDEDEDEEGGNDLKTNVVRISSKPEPSLSIKEKKDLASYAHSLGKKLKSQQVGKSGVTDTVVTALVETLEKNELLKLKIHGNCPAELADAVRQVEMGTGSVAVSQIGRTVILYRPSVTKLQAEQKKKLARRNLMKKNSVWIRSSPKSKEEMPKLSARGRRGSSRV